MSSLDESKSDATRHHVCTITIVHDLLLGSRYCSRAAWNLPPGLSLLGRRGGKLVLNCLLGIVVAVLDLVLFGFQFVASLVLLLLCMISCKCWCSCSGHCRNRGLLLMLRHTCALSPAWENQPPASFLAFSAFLEASSPVPPALAVNLQKPAML